MTLSTYKLNTHQFLICIDDGKITHQVTADKSNITTIVICYAYAIGYKLYKKIKTLFN